MFIEFTFNPKLLFIIIFPIFKESEKFISKLFITKGKDHNLFKIFRLFLSNELSFIFLLIFKCMNKSHEKVIVRNEHEINDDHEKSFEQEKLDEKSAIVLVDIEIKTVKLKNKIKSIIFLFLLSIEFVGAYLFNYYVRQPILRLCRNSIGIIFEVIIFYLLSYFILKERYHKHHYLSIAIICLSLIALFIIYSIQLNDDSIYNAFWYYLVYYSLYGFFDVVLKKYFLVYFYSIYFVLLILGASACIPMLIYDIIAFFINKKISGILIGFADNVNNVKNFFLFIVDLIFLFTSNLGIFWTVYYYTPFHLIICEFFSELIGYYIQYIQFKQGEIIDGSDFLFKEINIIIFSIIFFINLICSLIFNEIIILKFCTLEYDTKKYINERAQLDVSSLLTEDIAANSET